MAFLNVQLGEYVSQSWGDKYLWGLRIYISALSHGRLKLEGDCQLPEAVCRVVATV